MKAWSGDSESMYAAKSDVSPQMCYDAVWDVEVTCDQTYHSLCEKTCANQVEEPMECIAAQRSLDGNYVRWVRDSCLEENYFVCELPQTYDAEMEQGRNSVHLQNITKIITKVHFEKETCIKF